MKTSDDALGEERLALRWASLLAGPDTESDSPADAEKRVAAWAAVHLALDPAYLEEKIRSLPESCLTTRLWSAIRSAQSGIQKLKPFLDPLARGEAAFTASMIQTQVLFEGDEDRFLAWKRTVEGLPGFLRWLPAFEHAADYVADAFPTGRKNLDELRASLLESVAEPHRLLDSAVRDEFDRKFLLFKSGYIDHYSRAHEDTARAGSRKLKTPIDPVALRNLELLSGLRHANPDPIRKVRAIGKQLRPHECELPVKEILDRHPRCYCNFLPEASLSLSESAARINTAVGEGIDLFRSVLRSRQARIVQEMRSMEAGERTAAEIAGLLGAGPAPPLSRDCIALLNRIIDRYPREFHSAFKN